MCETHRHTEARGSTATEEIRLPRSAGRESESRALSEPLKEVVALPEPTAVELDLEALTPPVQPIVAEVQTVKSSASEPDSRADADSATPQSTLHKAPSQSHSSVKSAPPEPATTTEAIVEILNQAIKAQGSYGGKQPLQVARALDWENGIVQSLQAVLGGARIPNFELKPGGARKQTMSTLGARIREACGSQVKLPAFLDR